MFKEKAQAIAHISRSQHYLSQPMSWSPGIEKAKDERSRLWREMIALQEEIDWISYAMYGLIRFENPAAAIGVLDTDHP